MTDKSLRLTLGLSATLVALAIIISTIFPFIAPRLGLASGYGYGMMGPNHMLNGGMMGGFGFGLPFMGFGMILWPLLTIGLVVLGIVWLVRAVSPSTPTTTCAHCGKPVQPGWKACPHCGEKL